MEHVSELISLVGGSVSSILLPLLGVFMFYEQKRRKEEAEARKAEADNITQYAAEWKELYERQVETVDALNGKIDRLYAEKEEDRKRIRELQESNTAMALENQSLKIKECRRRGCTQREPPGDY